VPPLRERREDILLLAEHFLRRFAEEHGRPKMTFSRAALSRLADHSFPGNVRELENIVERGVALANGNVIELAHLPEDLKDLDIKTFRKREGRFPSLEEQEITYIQWILKETGGNKTLAASILGIDRVSLWRKIKKYGLQAAQRPPSS